MFYLYLFMMQYIYVMLQHMFYVMRFVLTVRLFTKIVPKRMLFAFTNTNISFNFVYIDTQICILQQ